MARLTALLLAIAACGNISRKQEDGGVRDDARMADASVPADGAATPDAPVAPPTESREITGGGARMTGATYTLDVQIGHGLPQNKATGATYQIEGNAGVKP